MKNFNILYKKALEISSARKLSDCAEHAAIAEMLKNGESRISEIIAVGSDKKVLSPCGRCRELILQINTDNKNTRIN